MYLYVLAAFIADRFYSEKNETEKKQKKDKKN